MRFARFAWSVSSLLAVACGGAQPAPPTEPPAATEAAAPPPEPAKPAASAELEKPAAKDASEEAPAVAPAPQKEEPDPNATREVTYVVVPDGLKISVAGVRFTVSASAVQVASGWGAKLNVVATSLDGKAHSLANPKSGPMAFAGSVTRKGKSEPDPFGDERTGDGELEVTADTPAKFNRTWPANGVRVLGAGDALDLQVALWGLGSDKDSRRPVKKFCHVRMAVDKGKPRAIVEPPQGVGK